MHGWVTGGWVLGWSVGVGVWVGGLTIYTPDYMYFLSITWKNLRLKFLRKANGPAFALVLVFYSIIDSSCYCVRKLITAAYHFCAHMLLHA